MAWTPTLGTAFSDALPLSTVSRSFQIPPHSRNDGL
jgi:hypothetical protein